MNPERKKKRDKDINDYFNQAYKRIGHGSERAKFNVAVHETAEKFYLEPRTIQGILSQKE